MFCLFLWKMLSVPQDIVCVSIMWEVLIDAKSNCLQSCLQGEGNKSWDIFTCIGNINNNVK
jgi:hypothetical protein